LPRQVEGRDMARRRTLYLPVMVAAAVLVACLVVSLALSERAQASFPGKNGRIAYFDRSESGDYEMYSMKPDGTGERLIARHGYASVFSPDGKRIAFTRDGELYKTKSDDSGDPRAVDGPVESSELAPDWGPMRTTAAG
jgi:hypothetical protein